jgi:hypothetical protein
MIYGGRETMGKEPESNETWNNNQSPRKIRYCKQKIHLNTEKV